MSGAGVGGFLGAVSSAVSRVQKTFYGAIEPEEVRNFREELKLLMHTSKMVAAAILVISAVSALFSTLFLLSMGTPFCIFLAFCDFVVGGAIAFVAYDATIAAEKGYQLADCPQYFTISDASPSGVVSRCQWLVTEMLKETYLLKKAQEFILDRYVSILSASLRNR